LFFYVYYIEHKEEEKRNEDGDEKEIFAFASSNMLQCVACIGKKKGDVLRIDKEKERCSSTHALTGKRIANVRYG
jgi:hypothetical protein